MWSLVQTYCQNKSSGTHCTQSQAIKEQIVFYEPQNLLISMRFSLEYLKSADMKTINNVFRVQNLPSGGICANAQNHTQPS